MPTTYESAHEARNALAHRLDEIRAQTEPDGLTANARRWRREHRDEIDRIRDELRRMDADIDDLSALPLDEDSVPSTRWHDNRVGPGRREQALCAVSLWGARSRAWVADSGNRWSDMISTCRCGSCT